MPQKPKVLDSPGARVTDICEPLYMGAGLELGSSAIIMHFCLFAYFVKFFWEAAARVSVCSLGCP